MGLLRFLFHNRSRILLVCLIYLILWFIIGNVSRSDNSNEKKLRKLLEIRQNTSFALILQHLNAQNIRAILIDPGILDHLFLRQYPFDIIDKPLITFGLMDQPNESFLSSFEGTEFSIEVSRRKTEAVVSIDHVFISHRKKILHLATLHKYHRYYRIEKNDVLLNDDIDIPFGDTVRIIEPTRFERLDSDHQFFYPKDVSHFLWQYETSEFISCDENMAQQMKTKFNLYQKPSQLNLTILPMRNIVRTLDRLEKRYWLAGGTLLGLWIEENFLHYYLRKSFYQIKIGWYRHCGLIPFTQDVDFGLFAEEYEESIRNKFLGDPVTYLWGALGLMNDSLEFRLYSGRFTFDLFWAYREGDHRWCGYQVHRVKFRRRLPLLERLCSGDLFGYRFTVPCSPIEYLNKEYGANKWQNPLEKNYTWVNMKFDSYWNDISWMYAVRLYTRRGELRTDKYAIDWISDHFNYSITTIPSFLNIVPDEPVILPPLKKKLVYVTRPKRNQTLNRRRKRRRSPRLR